MPNMLGHYILDRLGEPQRCESLLAWARWYEEASLTGARVVARDEFGGVAVSTVFLALDHGWHGGDPVLWETMVFSETDWSHAYDGEMLRYTTREAAIRGHAAVVSRLQAALQIN